MDGSGRANPKVGREYFWSAAEDRLLGKQPDAEVARLVGRAIAAVARRRQEAGIIFRPNPRWTKAEDRLLAQSLKEPRRRNATRELARQLGRSQAAVEMRRRKKFGRVQRTPRAWTRREERLLGTRSDTEVARLINRHLGVVHKRRHRLGIPSIVQRRPWTPAEERLLGTVSDEALAKKLGRSRTQIGARRCKLGIARYPRPGVWAPEDDRLLGTLPDKELARRLGRTLASVQVRRRIKKVPSVWPITYKPWSASEDALLGTLPDQEVSRVLGRGLTGVRRRRMLLHIRLKQWTNVLKGNIRKWTSAEVRLLGRRPDRKLAEQLGRSYGSVVVKRLSLGRPACPSGPRPTWWKPREVRLLGVVPDREVARRVGRSLASVQMLSLIHI